MKQPRWKTFDFHRLLIHFVGDESMIEGGCWGRSLSFVGISEKLYLDFLFVSSQIFYYLWPSCSGNPLWSHHHYAELHEVLTRVGVQVQSPNSGWNQASSPTSEVRVASSPKSVSSKVQAGTWSPACSSAITSRTWNHQPSGHLLRSNAPRRLVVINFCNFHRQCLWPSVSFDDFLPGLNSLLRIK